MGQQSLPDIKKVKLYPPPPRYALTPEGLELAQRLAKAEGLSTLNAGIVPEEPHEEESAESAPPAAALSAL